MMKPTPMIGEGHGGGTRPPEITLLKKLSRTKLD
jgi:hypothetical protein